MEDPNLNLSEKQTQLVVFHYNCTRQFHTPTAPDKCEGKRGGGWDKNTENLCLYDTKTGRSTVLYSFFFVLLTGMEIIYQQQEHEKIGPTSECIFTLCIYIIFYPRAILQPHSINLIRLFKKKHIRLRFGFQEHSC